MPHPPTQLALFVLCAAVAAAADVAWRRIPNWLTIPLLAGGLASAAELGAWRAATALVAVAIVATVLLPAWLGRRVGGGDLKFAAAAAAWVGLDQLAPFLLASAAAGGAVALVAWAASEREARRAILRNLRGLSRGLVPAVAAGAAGGGRVPVPAGAAFAAGAVWALVGG